MSHLKIKLVYWEQLFSICNVKQDRAMLWASGRRFLLLLLLLVHITLQIWEFGLIAPKNPLIWSLAHAYLSVSFFLLQDLHFIWITQIAICKTQMTAVTRASWPVNKLAQIWERSVRGESFHELYLFSGFSGVKSVSSNVHFVTHCRYKQLLLTVGLCVAIGLDRCLCSGMHPHCG